MDEYRRLLLLDSRREELAREAQLARLSRLAGERSSAKHTLITLAVLLLGMIAWWGQ